jgi:hypothetical protein
MEPSVQELLFDTVEEHEQLPSNSIRNWLSIHENLVRHSVKATMKRAIRGVRNIRNYFTKLEVTGQSREAQTSDENITTEFAAHL